MKIKYISRPYHKPNIKIISNCNDVIAMLSLQYRKYISDIECNQYITIQITESNENYIISHDDNEITTDYPLDSVIEIIADCTTYYSNILPLHGASVERNGIAYAFLASTTSGKTTLTSYLINNGYNYITDDSILLDKDTKVIYPYNCPISLRKGGLDVLNKCGIYPNVAPLINRQIESRYIYNPDNVVVKPVPLEQIYFIKLGSHNEISNMSVSDIMMTLMKSPMMPLDMSVEYIKLLSEISKQYGKRLIYKDMDFVLKVLENEH